MPDVMTTNVATYDSESEPPNNSFLTHNIGEVLYFATSNMPVVPTVPQHSNPSMEIVVQPKSKMRFRYSSERGSHGTLAADKKDSCPTIKLHNYNGPMPVFMRARLFTIDDHPIPHVHFLEGNNCKDGSFMVKFDVSMTAVMEKVKIIYCKAKSIKEVLRNRKGAQAVEREVEEEAVRLKNNRNMDYVRICFEALCYDDFNNCQPVCSPVFSNRIMHSVGDLVISRVSKVSGLADGEEEVFLLCSKVDKKDIEVIFAEYGEDEDEPIWSAKVRQLEVHHQYAIIFRTPPYRNRSIRERVTVHMYLYQPKKEETSNKILFDYIPLDVDTEGTSRKRKKVNPFEENNPPCIMPTVSVSNRVPNTSATSFRQTSQTSDYYTGESSSNEAFSPQSANTDTSEMSLPNFPFLLKCVEKFVSDETLGLGENSELPFPPLPPEDPNLLLVGEGDSDLFNDSDMQTDGLTYVEPIVNHSLNPCMHERRFAHHSRPPTGDVVGQMAEVQSLRSRESEVDEMCDGVRVLSIDSVSDSRNLLTSKSKLKLHRNLAGFIQEILNSTNLPDSSGNNFLHLAITHRSGAEEEQKIDFLCQLLEQEEISSLINQKNKRKQTPLHLAVMLKYEAVLLEMLLKGGDATIVDHNGDTVLHNAVKMCSHNCLDVLLNQVDRLNIEAINNDGVTALHCAVQKKCDECVKALCNKGAMVNSIDRKNGKSALHSACDVFPEILEYLVKQPSAEINSQDYSGNTPLHIACKNEFDKAVEILLKHGADKSIYNHVTARCQVDCRISSGQLATDLTSNIKILDLFKHHSSVCLNDAVQTGSAIKTVSSEKVEPEKDGCDSGFISGPISVLSDFVMKELCNMFDNTDDLKRLIMYMGMDNCNVDAVRQLTNNPTKDIITKYLEEEGNDVCSLKNALEFAGFSHAAKLI